MRDVLNLFKLRIGVAIAIAALAGFAVERGASPGGWQVVALILAVLVSSAAAGAFNQYVERDLDLRMARTRDRPFVTGRLPHHPAWLWLIGAMIAAAVLAATVATNAVAALHVFLGAFTYGVVYTVWLKRRTWWNIVIGGLAGSFAVLAGAAAVSPVPGPEALPSQWCCSFGRRRISGASPLPAATITLPRACPCSRWWWAMRAPHAPSLPARRCS